MRSVMLNLVRSLHTKRQIPRRALLYVPGSDKRKILKATSLNADCICLDIEDGVSATAKDLARETIAEVLDARTDFGVSEVAVRVNAVSTGIAEDDLTAIMKCQHPPSAIVVPKVDTVDESKWLVEKLQTYPAAEGLQLLIQIESAEGLNNLSDVCKFLCTELEDINGNLAAVIFGSDDFCASIGATRSAAGDELVYARQKVVTVSKAYKSQAIDMVHIDYKDMNGFVKYCKQGASFGFTGKQVIHPSQVKPAHECFAPSEEKVKWANGLIEAFEKYQQEGKGAFVYQGQMIDKPSLLQAENIKAIADLITGREL